MDFTTNISGSFAALVLADFGADVVKIERPVVGDDARRMPPTFNVIVGRYVQLHSELHEAALVSGASVPRVIRDIDLPLLRGAILSAFFLSMILIAGEVNASVMVFSPDSMTLPVFLWRILDVAHETQTAYVVALFQLVLTGALLVLAGRLGMSWARVQAGVGRIDRDE